MTRNPLDFTQLDEEPENDRRYASADRWPSRNPNETVQMSLRMGRLAYQQFRDLCKKERRTNGDMLEVLMRSYARSNKE
jgi:hypothetical protein